MVARHWILPWYTFVALVDTANDCAVLWRKKLWRSLLRRLQYLFLRRAPAVRPQATARGLSRALACGMRVLLDVGITMLWPALSRPVDFPHLAVAVAFVFLSYDELLLSVHRMPVGARSNLRPAVRPKIVKKKTNKFVRWHADLFKRMAVSNRLPFTNFLHLPIRKASNEVDNC